MAPLNEGFVLPAGLFADDNPLTTWLPRRALSPNLTWPKSEEIEIPSSVTVSFSEIHPTSISVDTISFPDLNDLLLSEFESQIRAHITKTFEISAEHFMSTEELKIQDEKKLAELLEVYSQEQIQFWVWLIQIQESPLAVMQAGMPKSDLYYVLARLFPPV